MHSSTFLLSEILNKWEISIGHTEKLFLSQEEQNRHSLKTWHRSRQPLQYPHSSTQTLQIIEELLHKTFWSSEEKNEELHSLHFTCCEAWTQVLHLMSHLHWLTVLIPLLFKEFTKNSEIILVRVQTSKNKNILIS